MKKLIAALSLVVLIAVPTLTTSASAQVSPASPTFGSNGYWLPTNFDPSGQRGRRKPAAQYGVKAAH